jgi:hypothetical protein
MAAMAKGSAKRVWGNLTKEAHLAMPPSDEDGGWRGVEAIKGVRENKLRTLNLER